jgi:hypothetical protein
MKNLLNAIFFILIVSACQSDQHFDFPVEHTQEDPTVRLAEFKEQVISADDGWKGLLITKSKISHSLFLKISESDEMILFTDINEESAKGKKSSCHFKLMEQMNPSLVFDKNSNLDLIEEKGTDLDFTIKNSTPDAVYLIGNKYGNELKLTRALPSEREDFEAGKFALTLKAVSDYLSTLFFIYSEISPARPLQLRFLPANRFFLSFSLNENKTASAFGSSFCYTPNGILFKEPIYFDDKKVDQLFWDINSKKLFAQIDEKRFDFSESRLPVIPFHYLSSEEYKHDLSVVAPDQEALPGWSDKFKNYWADDSDLMAGAINDELAYVDFSMNYQDNSMSLNVWYVEDGKQYEVGLPYQFSKTADGIFDFTALPVDATTVIGKKSSELQLNMPNLFSVINNQTFRIDFYDSIDELGEMLIQFQSVEDAQVYFTATFYL